MCQGAVRRLFKRFESFKYEKLPAYWRGLLAMSLSVEVAEIVEHFQWLTEEQRRNLPPDKIAEIREEIGDVMIYLTELADKLDLDPVEAARAKLEVNKSKYPAALVRGKSSKYTEY